MKACKKLALLTAVAMMAVFAGACANNAAEPSATPSATTTVRASATPEASQTPATTSDAATVKLGLLNGPTGLGAMGLHKENAAGNTKNKYDIQYAGAPDELVGKLTSGEIDAATVPTNVAATLYNKTNGNVVQVANITLGVLYIVEKGDSIKSVEDLKGKTIYAAGQGSTPEYVLNYILEQNGLKDDVKVEYLSEHSEVIAQMQAGKAEVALLPEPHVTNALAKVEGSNRALDITKEWEAACKKAGVKDSKLVMSSIVMKKDYVQANAEAVKNFMDDYSASIEYINANVAEVGTYVEKNELLGMKAAIVEKALPNCNQVFITGEEMKAMTGTFLDVLFKANPKSVGGSVPADDFYYEK